MKKINKSNIFSFILGALLFSGITGVLAYKLAANQVGFTPSDSTWQVSDVDNALDSLFDMATYGDASASDIVSGKTALVNGAQVTGNLTVPSYQTLANTENVSAGSSSSTRTGYYYLNNYKVTCGTTTCPSYTSLSGTQNVSAGSSSTTLNGYYNLSNYKVSCGTNSCPACNSCCSSTWKYGSFSCTSSTCDINIGFQPSILYAIGVDGANQAILTDTYNSSYSTSTTYSIWKVSNGTSFASYSMGTTKPGAIKYINSNGFTVTKSSNTNNWIYFAR